MRGSPLVAGGLVMTYDGNDISSPDFATLLRSLRQERRLTQEQLAAKASPVSVRTIQDLERGKNKTARLATAADLARALDLSGADRNAFLDAAAGRTTGAGVDSADATNSVKTVAPPTPDPTLSQGSPETSAGEASHRRHEVGTEPVAPASAGGLRRRGRQRMLVVALGAAVAVLGVSAAVTWGQGNSRTSPGGDGLPSQPEPATSAPFGCASEAFNREGLAVATQTDGTEHAVMRDADNSLRIGPLGDAGEWSSPAGPPLSSQPAAAKLHDGRLVVYTADCGHPALRKAVVDGTSTSAWESVSTPTVVNYPPALVATPDGALYVFYVDTFGDGYVQVVSDTGVTDWTQVGSGFTSGGVGVSHGAGDVQLFSRDKDGTVVKARHKPQSGWSDWSRLVPPIAMAEGTVPGVVRTAPRAMELVILAHNGRVYYVPWRDGNWGEWIDLATPATSGTVSQPVAVLDEQDHLQVIVRTSDSQLSSRSRGSNGSSWTDWSTIGT